MPASLCQVLQDSFAAAVAAALPENFMDGWQPAVSELLPNGKKDGEIIVIAAGKAAGGMARAAEEYYSGTPMRGIVVIPQGETPPTLSRLSVLSGSHPLPDEQSVAAARAVLECVKSAKQNDAVLALISGGASSLIGAPVAGLELATLRGVGGRLLLAGADVREINVVRRQLGLAAGGRLAAASIAPVFALICSDVVNGAPADIASGPCAPSPTNADDALTVLRKYGIDKEFPALCAQLQAGDFVLPSSSDLQHAHNTVIFDSNAALQAGGKILTDNGLEVVSLGEQTAPIKTLAEEQLRLLLQRTGNRRASAGSGEGRFALVSGGEGQSAVFGEESGTGGRNTAFALQAWLLAPPETHDKLSVLSCDTDGIDGAQTAAGALWTPEHRRKAAQLNLSPQTFLTQNNSGAFFKQLDALITTGPTGANVSDYRVLVLEG